MNKTTKLLDIKTDNIIDYKKTSLLLVFPFCSGKCGEECQNKHLMGTVPTKYKNIDIINLYTNLPSHGAVVFAGLEPWDSFLEMKQLVKDFISQYKTVDIVIYTGYEYNEIKNQIQELVDCFNTNVVNNDDNLIIKCGMYDVNKKEYWKSDILGVNLATTNQTVISFNKNSTNNTTSVIKEGYNFYFTTKGKETDA